MVSGLFTCLCFTKSMAPLLLLLSIPLTAVTGWSMIKRQDQKIRDRQRKTYRLSFPNELDAASVTAWIRSISGTLRSSRTRLYGTPTIAFELWADSSGITHRMKVPWQHADYITSQLRYHVPGIRTTLEDEIQRREWTQAVEVGLTNTSRQLRIYDASAASGSLLASVQAMKPGETVMMQWIASPAIPQHRPVHGQARSHHVNLNSVVNGGKAGNDEVNDRRAKLEEPNVLAVLRVGAEAETSARASHLIYRVRAALASTRSASVRFNKRIVTKKKLQQRIDQTTTSFVFPMQLSAPELATLIAWPIGNPNVSGLPPTLARQLPASDLVPREGRILGRSNFPGNERPVALNYEQALKHVHVIGPTGVGKTVLLGNMLRQDMENGYGAILIENKGDLFRMAMNYVPQERLNDVVVLDVSDRKFPLGFNILNQGNPLAVVDEIVALFDHLYRDTRSVWTREVLYHALRTLITDPKLTFVDLAPLLVPMTKEEIDWADNVKRSLTDPELRNFWQRFDNQDRKAQDRITQPVMDRVWQLNARPEIRNIIGQSESAFQMTDVMKDNKILLVNLEGLPRDTATLMGTLLMNSIWSAAKQKLSVKPTFLYLDEFQDFMHLPVDADDMLAKARGFGLGMTLAHQHLSQLPKAMEQAVLANARTKVVFQTTADDSKAMTREFGTAVSDSDFMGLGKYEALAKVATGDGVSTPLTMSSLEPPRRRSYASQLRTQSRNVHAKPVADVEAEIRARRVPEKAPKTRRPAIGGSPKWGGNAGG